jgi:hypothetical protein
MGQHRSEVSPQATQSFLSTYPGLKAWLSSFAFEALGYVCVGEV